LSISRCEEISDEGLDYLSESLKGMKNLHKLYLSFTEYLLFNPDKLTFRCWRITDVSLNRLGVAIVNNLLKLEELVLYFRWYEGKSFWLDWYTKVRQNYEWWLKRACSEDKSASWETSEHIFWLPGVKFKFLWCWWKINF